MAAVYIDSIFALNAAADYFLLRMTALLAGVPPRRGRYLCAAALGGAYAAAVYLPGCAFLTAAPVKCAAGVGLALAAFGNEERLFRLTALFFAVSCAFAGCVLALALLTGRNPDGGTVLGAALGFYAAAALGFRAAARRHTEAAVVPVRVRVLDREAELTALLDSGNGLRDAGRPVLVASPGAADALLPRTVRPLAAPDRLRSPADLLEPMMAAAPELRPRLIPYRAVGVEAGLLLTVACRWLEIGGERRENVRLALSPTELGTGYQALWGGGAAPEKGGAHGNSDGVAGSAGRPDAAVGAALHRRKRYPAAAADPGAGGGTAGTYGGGIRPPGAD